MSPIAALLAAILLSVSSAVAQITSAPATLVVSNNLTTVNYSQNETPGFTGDPNIFGGNGVYITTTSTPGGNAIGAQQITTYGMNIIRTFAAPSNIVPTTTVSAYLSALGAGCTTGSVCDPSTWIWNTKNTDNYIVLARANGAKVLLNLLGTTTWNDYSGSGSGVPQNFTVYGDIAKKIYQHWTPDYFEIGNEPDNTLSANLGGSPYSTAQSAYFAIYQQAATAVRSASSSVPIGGPTICCDVPSNWINQFLTNSISGISAGLINFVTYHNYMNNNNELMNGQSVPQYVKNSPQPSLLTWVTEWNANSDCDTTNPDDGDANPSTVPFWGMRFVNFINNGISKSFYWRMWGDDTGCSAYNFPTSTFNSKTRVELIMSVVLGLGVGPFTVSSSTNTGSTAAMGAINSSGQHVAVVVNDSSQALTQTVTLNNTGFTTNKTWNTYIASIPNTTPSTPVESVSVTPSGGSVTHTISVPANAVAGVLVQ